MKARRGNRADPIRTGRRVPEGEGHSLGSERVRDLKQALERLPYEQREVLILRHLAGLCPREIARILDTTEAAIHGLHQRALTGFKDGLRELEAMPLTKP
jgi:RNA polymerase sigma factor (sigma-70 family)